MLLDIPLPTYHDHRGEFAKQLVELRFRDIVLFAPDFPLVQYIFDTFIFRLLTIRQLFLTLIMSSGSGCLRRFFG